MQDLSLEVAFTPALVGDDYQERIWVVIDVLRASSTIVTLLERGCRVVHTVREITRARSLAHSEGCLIGGERNCLPLKGFDFGNSPPEANRLELEGKSVVLTTTNGTKAVQRVAAARGVLIGSLLNAGALCRAVAKLARQKDCGIGLLCAGELDRFVLDDTYCAGLLTERITSLEPDLALSDSARGALYIYRSYTDSLTALRESSSGCRLLELQRGFDVDYCAQVDHSKLVPVLTGTDPATFTPLALG